MDCRHETRCLVGCLVSVARGERLSIVKMWLCLVLWRLSTLLIVAGTIDIGFFTQKRHYVPSMQMNCYEYPKFNTDKMSTVFGGGFKPQRVVMKRFSSGHPIRRRDIHIAAPRSFQQVLNWQGDIYKEHAKLVQDINSLKQVVFVAPLVDDNRDYDESIFHDMIEMSTTTSPKPTLLAKSTKPSKSSSIPIIYVGGATNTRQVVKSQPITFPKTSVSLVGTTGSPTHSHPYPFVMHQDQPSRPIRVCMPTMAPLGYSATTKQPSLLQRLLNAIIPR